MSEPAPPGFGVLNHIRVTTVMMAPPVIVWGLLIGISNFFAYLSSFFVSFALAYQIVKNIPWLRDRCVLRAFLFGVIVTSGLLIVEIISDSNADRLPFILFYIVVSIFLGCYSYFLKAKQLKE